MRESVLDQLCDNPVEFAEINGTSCQTVSTSDDLCSCNGA